MNRPLSEKDRMICQQDELIHRLSWSRNFGCFNKQGFEEMKWPEKAHVAKWLVYFDVDGVHEINEEAGTYDVFNAMMQDVFRTTLRTTDVIAAQKNSGDEFVVLLTEEKEPDGSKRKVADPYKIVELLTEALARHGLTAIFAVVEVKSLLLEDNMKIASDRVLAEKKARGVTRSPRGTM